MPKKGIEIPEKWDDYTVKELRVIAEDEFAVAVPENANVAEVKAAFAESGVTWAQHVANHPEFTAVEEPEVIEEAPGAVTTEDMEVMPEEPVETKIVVKEETPLHTKEEWLIRMVRENPLYEVRGHRFTQENPFALVTPEDAEYMLTKEDGFRQATPSELQIFFG